MSVGGKCRRMLEINSESHERHYSRELKEKEPMKWVGLRYLLQNYGISFKPKTDHSITLANSSSRAGFG